MNTKKFDPKKLKKLNNPQRLRDIPPGYIQGKLQIEKAEVMVDIGAGTAFFSIALLNQFGARKIYACDTSQIMIDWITENVVTDHPEILPILSKEDEVPLDSSIADVVFMINLHHELDYPEQTLKESHRLLTHGGKIVIIDWKKMQMEEGPPEKIRCDQGQVLEQLVRYGFGNVKVHVDLDKHFLVVGEKIRSGK